MIAQIQRRLKRRETASKPKSGTVSGNLSKIFDAYAYLQHARVPILEVFGGIGTDDFN